MADKDGFDLRKAPNGYWYIHWTEGRRSKRLSTHRKDLREARAFATNWQAANRHLSAKNPAPPTCGVIWARYWREHVVLRCSCLRTHEYAWKRLEPRFGKLNPSDVTWSLVQAHVAARRPAKPTSLHVELSLLYASWNFGIKRRLLEAKDVPPRDELGFPPPPPPRDRWFRQAEVDRMFEAFEAMRQDGRMSRVERFIWLALYTGGRLTALVQLKWDQVDLEKRIVHLNPDGRVQTTKKRASVPIADGLYDILCRAYEERINDYVLDKATRLQGPLAALGERARVLNVTAHVFRHTAASWMARHGIPMWKIAKVLGCSVEQVERTYAKHNLDDLRDAVNSISTRKKG